MPVSKASMALDAIKENQTLAELAMRYEVASGQITAWKRQLTENVAGVGSGAIQHMGTAALGNGEQGPLGSGRDLPRG
jgi:hypothetical protein